jgi:hypothetical protein
MGKVALGYLRGRNIGIDGVEDKVRNYQAFGFKLAYHNIRFVLPARIMPVDDCVARVRDIDFKNLLAYDRLCFPAPREAFLKHWFSLPNSFSAAVVDGGALQGFCLIRRCRQGYKIGPLFADNERAALNIYSWLVSGVQAGAPVFLDVPEINSAAMAIAAKLKMERVLGTARMYSGQPPDIDINRVFGVTSYELG